MSERPGSNFVPLTKIPSLVHEGEAPPEIRLNIDSETVTLAGSVLAFEEVPKETTILKIVQYGWAPQSKRLLPTSSISGGVLSPNLLEIIGQMESGILATHISLAHSIAIGALLSLDGLSYQIPTITLS